MAASPSDSNSVISSINVTPLVDIVLVLLIIFMVTAKLVVAPNAALKITLPRSRTGEQVSPVFAVAMLRDGTLRVNGQVVPDDRVFLDRARAEHQAHPDLRAVIQADGEVTHARVVHLMDLLSQAGVTQIAFAVTLEPGAATTP
jgi:biopolymer transport protein TolR